MKKLMIGLMGLVMMGAMALPAAAQSRNWRPDDQVTSRADDHRGNDFDSSRRDDRDRRYENERSWNRHDVYVQEHEREHHRGLNFRVRIF
jgi:hypothetical protein